MLHIKNNNNSLLLNNKLKNNLKIISKIVHNFFKKNFF